MSALGSGMTVEVPLSKEKISDEALMEFQQINQNWMDLIQTSLRVLNGYAHEVLGVEKANQASLHLLDSVCVISSIAIKLKKAGDMAIDIALMAEEARASLRVGKEKLRNVQKLLAEDNLDAAATDVDELKAMAVKMAEKKEEIAAMNMFLP